MGLLQEGRVELWWSLESSDAVEVRGARLDRDATREAKHSGDATGGGSAVSDPIHPGGGGGAGRPRRE